jgi:hypothetical protein
LACDLSVGFIVLTDSWVVAIFLVEINNFFVESLVKSVEWKVVGFKEEMLCEIFVVEFFTKGAVDVVLVVGPDIKSCFLWKKSFRFQSSYEKLTLI